MTGSVDDADDIVQETLFRAWRGLGSYVSRGSFRAWLYRIATNRTLDLIGSAPRRHEVVNSAGEPSWLQPFPTEGVDDEMIELEAIGLAFVVALQKLPARQRAALLLCDVLGFTAVETAELLSSSVAATNSLLQRARATLEKIRPPKASPPADASQKALVDRFVAAWQKGDTEGMLALLDDSAHLTMPPHEIEFLGPRAIVDLLLDVERFAHHTLVEFMSIRANGEHGIATFTRTEDGGHAGRHCIMLFAPTAGGVSKITGFTEDPVFNLFDLPMRR